MKILRGVVVLLLASMLVALPAGAASLQIAPLVYDDAVLQKGESKKGFVDVTNPDSSVVKVAMSAQAFRQIDNQGSLEFYFDERITQGVRLDLEGFTLGPREAMRVYFLLDGTKLPSGDVFAAILARIEPEAVGGSTQTVQVGTLLLVQNGTVPARSADIAGLRAPWLQIGSMITADVIVKNTADEKTTTGFSPVVSVALLPYSTNAVKGPLIFAGRERVVDYRQSGDFFGPMVVKVSHGASSKSQMIFAITGYWRWLAPVIGVGIVVVWLLMRRPVARKARRKG